MQMTADEQRAMEALQGIEKELTSKSLVAAGKTELCEKYRKIRGYLEIALPMIERIPIYGKKVAEAIRFLITLADLACPA